MLVRSTSEDQIKRHFENDSSIFTTDGSEDSKCHSKEEEDGQTIFLKLNHEKEMATVDKQGTFKSGLGKEIAIAYANGTLPGRILKKSKRPPTVIHINGIRKIECTLEKWLWHLGKYLARAPTLGFVLPLILFVLIVSSMFFNREKLSSTSSPFNGTDRQEIYAKHTRDAINSLFPDSTSLDPMDPAQYAVMIKAKNRLNAAEEKALLATVTELTGRLKTVPVVNKTSVTSLNEICRRAESGCSPQIVQLISIGQSYSDQVTAFEVQSSLLSSLKPPDAEYLSEFRALLQLFRKPRQLANEEEEAKRWESYLQFLIGEFNKKINQFAELSLWSGSAFQKSTKTSVDAAVGHMPNCFIVILLGSILLTLKRDGYVSRPLLGALIALGLLILLVTSMVLQLSSCDSFHPGLIGTLFYIAATFLFFNFNLIQSWRKFCNVSSHPVEKFRLIMSVEVTPICITIFCLMISYWILAMVTNLELLKSTAQLIASSMMYGMVVMLFFFPTALYLSGRLEAAGLKWFQFCAKGDTVFTEPTIMLYDRREVRQLQSRLLDTDQSWERSLGIQMCNLHVRLVGLLVYTVYAIFACWAMTTVRVDIYDSSYLTQSGKHSVLLRDYHAYFNNREEQLEMIFYDHVNYNESHISDTLLGMFQWLEHNSYASTVNSWLKDYAEWHMQNQENSTEPFEDILRFTFLKRPDCTSFEKDMIISPDGHHILSRMSVILSGTGKNNLDVITAELTRRAEKAGLPMFLKASTQPFLYHNTFITDDNTAAVITVTVVTFFMLLFLFAKPAVAILVTFFHLSVLLGTMGFSAIFNVNMNVHNVALLLAGMAHSTVVAGSVCSYYCNLMDVSAKMRASYAFQSTALSLIGSSLLTTLSFLPMLASNMPVFVEQTKLISIHFALTIFHYLLILPPGLLLLTVNLPAFKRLLKKQFDETSCLCFGCCPDSEKAESICYIPSAKNRSKLKALERLHSAQARTNSRLDRQITMLSSRALEIGCATKDLRSLSANISEDHFTDQLNYSASNERLDKTRSKRSASDSGVSSYCTSSYKRTSRRAGQQLYNPATRDTALTCKIEEIVDEQSQPVIHSPSECADSEEMIAQQFASPNHTSLVESSVNNFHVTRPAHASMYSQNYDACHNFQPDIYSTCTQNSFVQIREPRQFYNPVPYETRSTLQEPVPSYFALNNDRSHYKHPSGR